LIFAAWVLFGSNFLGGNSESDAITFTVAKRDLRDIVVERGALESQSTKNGICQLPGYESRIIEIVPEGTLVKKGQVVVKFDSSKIENQIRQQKISVNSAKGALEQAKQQLNVAKNQNESNVKEAELQLKLAKLDLAKYRDGDYKTEVSELERSISEGQAELEKANDNLANFKTLVKKGFRSPEQLREIQFRVDVAKFRLDRDEQKLVVLKDFEQPRKITEYEFNAEETERKLERAKTTAIAEEKKAQAKVEESRNNLQMRKSELTETEGRLVHCEIMAPQSGTLAYANQPWFGAGERIREGATVRQNQQVFQLPDMSRMQVKVNVHESTINKIKKGQKASIRIDAYPDRTFEGTVEKIAQLASSSWYSETKNYEAVVKIDSFPDDVDLKPGMTAEVEIEAGMYLDVLAIPVNAVTEHFNQSYVYVRNGNKFIRQQVKIGRSTNSFVEITEGLADSDVVAMDAYYRGMQEFGDAERSAEELKKDDPATSSPVTASPGVVVPGN